MAKEEAKKMESAQIANPAEHLKENSEKLAKYGGFDLLEACIDGAQNLNPERKARKKIFLTESSKESERDTLKKILSMWSDVISSSENITDMVEKSEKSLDVAGKSLNKNLGNAIKETKDLERSYRSMALFYKNTESDKVKNISILNAELDQIKDLDNTRFIDGVAEELKSTYDRLDLRENYGLLVIPGYLGSNKVVEKWAKIAHENKVMLVTDFEHLDEVTAGKKFGGLNEVDGVKFDLKKSEIAELEKLGLVPMVNEYSKVMAFSAKTLFNGDNLGLQTYSVVRVFDYVTKVLMDFLNRRAFENFNAKTRKDIMGQIVKFLDGVAGPNKLIEDFDVKRLEQDPNQKDRIYLDIHMKPYFPAKNFLIRLEGQKGDDGNDWEAEYDQS